MFINPWADWWTAKAITNADLSLWHTDYIFYPTGANLVYHSFSHLNTLVSLGLRPFVGPLPAYNLSLILNLVLIGFSVFQLVHYLTKSAVAGVLAGIVLAFNFQIQYQTSHPVTFSIWCLPWMTLYLIRAARENQVRWAVAAAVFVFLGAATGIHILLLSLMWLALLLIYMVVATEFPRPSWKIVTAFGLTSAILILPLLFPLLREAFFNQNSSFVVEAGNAIVTDIASVVVPHWVNGNIRTMYLGIMPAILFLFAFFVMGRRVTLWLILFLGAYLIAIGPNPTFRGQELDMVLHWSEPVASLMRQTYRMMLLFAFGWAMLTAYGWLGLEKVFRLRGKIRVASAVLVGLFIFIDFTQTPFPRQSAEVSGFYTEYLEAVPDDVGLAILPIGRQQDKRYMYYQTIHQHPMTGGVVSRPEEGTFRFMRSIPLLRFGSIDLEPVEITAEEVEASFEQLAAVNVGFLVLDKERLAEVGEDIGRWQELIGWEPVYEDELVVVYKTD